MHLPASGLLRPFSTITLLPACAPGPAADRCLFYSSIRETIAFSAEARGCSPRTPVTFCTAKKSPKSRQGGFAPSGHPHSSWAGGARECLPCLDSSLPLNCCALPWQDWQNVKLRLPALHVEVPAELRSGCAMRTRQEEQARPHRAGGPVVSSKNRAARRRTQR